MDSGQMHCKHIYLAEYSSGPVSEKNFSAGESEMNMGVEVGSGDVLVRNIFVSVDPWARLCMHSSNQGLYMPPFELNKPLPALIVSEVIASDDPEYRVGEYVTGLGTVSEYNLITGGQGVKLRKVDANVAPLHNYLGLLGLPGLTAWVGIVRSGQAKTGEEVFISAASGGVGLAAGQLAKLKGCRVIGSAGSDEKVQMLKEQFGFDDAFNYKTETDWDATLKRFFPNGIDIYFDNVGGKMLDAALNHIKFHARVPISGMISQYNQDRSDAAGVRNLMNLVGRCARMEGFLAMDSAQHFQEFLDDVLPPLLAGEFKSIESISDGLENFPKTFVGMMNGQNIGKAVVRCL